MKRAFIEWNSALVYLFKGKGKKEKQGVLAQFDRTSENAALQRRSSEVERLREYRATWEMRGGKGDHDD